MSDYLLEIGLEEMPAHLVTPAVNQLEERLRNFLEDNLLPFEKTLKFSTPRRLAILVKGLAKSSEAKDEEIKGPSVKIAKDEAGNWSKAIQGFAKGQGVSPEELQESGGYYYAHKHISGVRAEDLLTGVGETVISKMQFSTYMKWGNYNFHFIRPIQWLVSLLDDKVVPFAFLDLTAGRVTKGHRFLSDLELSLDLASNYESVLADHFVLVNADQRQSEIVKQVEELVNQRGWQVNLHPALLEEVNNLVEYPTAFVGNFDERYLWLPEEVLVTSMRDNQRYFEVYTKENKLAPHFISVRNGNAHEINRVIAGNEKVLVARLEDAEFFYQEDQKLQISDLVKKLEKVSFHAKIGSMREHMERTQQIAANLANLLGLTRDQKVNVARASEIYKFDLLTTMVGEFPELQGIVGEKYALLEGEHSEVARAIREHYLPVVAEGDLPRSTEGAVLAVADKLDALLSFFKAGLVPSGSNDPYALRRAALGILRIIGSHKWSFDLAPFLEGRADLLDFFKDRIRKLLEDDVRYDLIEAALQVPVFNVFAIVKSALALQDASNHENFKQTVENLTRVFKLADQQEIPVAVDSTLFENEFEEELARTEKAIEMIPDSWSNLMELTFLSSFVFRFLEETMVMVDDLAVRNNRLALLKKIADKARLLADFSLIATKIEGDK